jgi:hypothetical protein
VSFVKEWALKTSDDDTDFCIIFFHSQPYLVSWFATPASALSLISA